MGLPVQAEEKYRGVKNSREIYNAAAEGLVFVVVPLQGERKVPCRTIKNGLRKTAAVFCCSPSCRNSGEGTESKYFYCAAIKNSRK